MRPKGKMTLKEFDKPGSLLVTTRTLLKADRRTLREMADNTGIPFFWLKKFSANEIPNPSVNRVQYLFEKLTESKIV